MKPNLTEIVVILDKSGSMSDVCSSTISSFNEFIEMQKKTPGEANFTMVLFSSYKSQETVYDAVPIAEAKKLTRSTYSPAGMTALLDAIGTTIDAVGKRLDSLSEDDKPSKVIFCIITDGQENHSKDFRNTDIAERIEHQTSKYDWEFMYIGANQDSIVEARKYGIRNSANYVNTDKGIMRMSKGMSNAVSSYRSTGTLDMTDLNKEEPAT